jgi:hypothetical protein
MQTSVQSAQKISFRRPVAWTARTNSVSSQELTVGRSSAGLSWQFGELRDGWLLLA